MAANSAIEWTHSTWNPVTGCTKVTQGCKNCYAERMAHRLRAMNVARYGNGFGVTLHDDLVDLPRTWREPRLIFVNSMSDLFHEAVPLDFIRRLFGTMADCRRHTFQVLTKRSARLREVHRELAWPANVWMGVSVEDASVVYRIHDLVSVPAAVRFLSCEPLLGPLHELPLDGIGWVVAGGESGPRARPVEADWVRSIRQQCEAKRVPFFFKQWGGVHKHTAGRVLDGRTHDAMPAPA